MASKSISKQRKIAIVNNKGGVAKSSSIINIAYFLQKWGNKVLIVDCDDSQQNSLSFFRRETAVYIHKMQIDVVSYADYKSGKYSGEYNWILMDLPPSLTAKIKRIIGSCDVVFVPTILGDFEASGLANLTTEIKNQGTKLGGIFVTHYVKKNDFQAYKEFNKALGDRLMVTVIPYSATVRESQKMGMALEDYFNFRNVPDSKIARKVVVAYERLATEIVWRCNRL